MRQALYRMYRPKSFDEVFGQDPILSILKNQIKNNSVSHAYLFAGPRGTGKTSTAKLFAAALNQGSDIDTIELDAASNNSVEDIREIVDNAALAPFGGKYKIYILDEAHMLSKSAFNALLKTLEEPPQHVIFILATTEPNRIPKTILSRTLRFDFAKITPEVIIQRLKEVLASENIPYAEEALAYIAQKSGGGLRDALSLLDKAISYGELNELNVVTALGAIDANYQYRMIQALVQNQAAEAVKLLNAIEGDGIEPRIFLLDLIEYLKNILLFKNGIDTGGMQVEEAAEILTEPVAAYLIEELSSASNLMRTSANPEIQMLASLVRLCHADFEHIDLYRNIPAQIREEFSAQKSELLDLRRELAELRAQLSVLSTYPQNPVDKQGFSVDNSWKSPENTEKNVPHLSTMAEITPVHPVEANEISRQEISESEREALEKVKSFFPELKIQLKTLKKVQVASLMEMAEPMRFIKGNLFFVYREPNKGICKLMLNTQPNSIVDPILSKLYGQAIITHYITEDELRGIREDDFEAIVDKISENFPGVKLEIT